ncbi:MAG: 5-oxoprolinase subunit PxpA [Gemmatimonadaceae bacterium]|nr:5-oxoprolinase subunit PxpA [Gemmatimonadaceae bacterium]
MAHVDLNCDMGESHGVWTIGADAAVLPHVTSINVACGFHGGDPSVMRATVLAAAAHQVAIGAHPGLPDLLGFGRREMAVSPQEVCDMVVYQLGALQAFAAAVGVRVCHVKPHGALYNMAAVRRDLADAIADAVHSVDASLVLVGLSGSALIAAGTARGLPVAHEVFADRNYRADGTLVPRTMPDALITDVDIAVARVVRMVQQGRVLTVDGTDMPVAAQTICIHGDAPGAPMFAQRIRAALHAAGITPRALSTPPHG